MALTTDRNPNHRPVSTINIVLGAWLFLSSFLWFHSANQFTNAWLVGLVSAVAAAAAIRFPAWRFVNTVAGAWLLLSVWILRTPNEATLYNHVIVGAAMFIVSLLPGVTRTHHTTSHRAV